MGPLLNLPNYLAPAPPFDERHDLDWTTVVLEIMRAVQTIRCTCGEKIEVSEFAARNNANAGQAFWDKFEVHYYERRARAAFLAKWGPNSPPIAA
jgi:hypothetical protein